MTLLHDDELADYRALIKKSKFIEADFLLEEGPMREGEAGIGNCPT